MSHSHQRPRSPLYAEQVSPAVQTFLPPEISELVEDSLRLLSEYEQPTPGKEFNDYAFIIFPLAKAYEGFLKLYFFQIGVLRKDVYWGRTFRIGRSFNPDLPARLRDDVWIYDDVSRRCGPDLARELWQLWLDARNHLFHFFPDDRYVLSSGEARALVERVLSGMDAAVTCRPGL